MYIHKLTFASILYIRYGNMMSPLSAMRPSQSAIDMIKSFESLRLVAYPDPGSGAAPWTIGWGSTRGVTQGMTITEAQAEARLAQDLADAAVVVNAAVKVPLSQNQFDALVDFVFNVGAGKKGLRSGFVELKSGSPSTLLRLINAGNFQAAANQFSAWTMASGHVMPGLVKRRAAERALFVS